MKSPAPDPGTPRPGTEKPANDRKRFILRFVGLSALSWLVYFTLVPGEPKPGKGAPPAKPLQTIKISEAKRNVRAEVSRVLGKADAELAPQDRLELLRSLGEDLNEEEREAMFAALLAKPPDGTSAGWHAEYVHELACKLQEQGEDRDRFARVLATMAGDSSREEVLRDYALQHLRLAWVSAKGEKTAEGDLQGSIEATFRALAKEDPVVGASALLSLHLLGTISTADGGLAPTNDNPGMAGPFQLPDKEVEPVVQDILAKPQSSAEQKARMTALRITGERKLVSQTAAVRKICADPAEHALVRMAAISTFAKLAGPSDRSFLESLNESDPRLAGAVRHALLVLQ